MFANGVALRDLSFDRRQLLRYLNEISASARNLAVLLRMPQEIPADGEDIHPEPYREIRPYVVGQLFWWFSDDNSFGLEDLTDGLDYLERLSGSAMEEYSLSKGRQGPSEDLTLKEFLAELITITNTVLGPDGLALPRNDDRDELTTPLLSFIRRSLKHALDKGKDSITASRLTPEQQENALNRLNNYNVMNSTLITYCRPLISKITLGQRISSRPSFGLPR